MELRTDLAVEAREIAGEDVGGVDFVQYSENGLDISRLEVKTRKARQQLGKEEGTYITVELPSLTDNFYRNRRKTYYYRKGNSQAFAGKRPCTCSRTRKS